MNTENETTNAASSPAGTADAPKEDDNRSHRPSSKAFKEFMASGWGPRPPAAAVPSPAAAYLPARHQRVGAPYPGERLVIPAGGLVARVNDTDHRFRADSSFIYLTGLTGELEPDAVLLLEPAGADKTTHEAVLYFQPRASRSSEQFYADARYGEFWVGARPSLAEMEQMTGLKCRPIDELRDALQENAGAVPMRVVPEVAPDVERLVTEARVAAGLEPAQAADKDAELARHIAELRLRKDEYEVAELEKAVAATKIGFERIIAALPQARAHARGERILEGAFAAAARELGNAVGYDTIAAAGNHANTLHWTDNSGPVDPGSLVLIDAGIELDSLYTGDITRTLPASGKFSPAQAKVYQAVLDALEAAYAAAGAPGARYRDMHAAAMEVIANRLEEWGALPVSAAESLAEEGQQHRRWMPHGTGHHLGLDVHDGTRARRETYQNSELEEGMVFTIEPGLYFREDDLTVPEELRGIGVRVEDNIVVEAGGKVRRLSEDIPRTLAGVENWMAEVWARED